MKKGFLSILILIIIIALAISPNIYIKASGEGILVWATIILPAIFPFLFFTKILTDLGVINTITNKFTLFAKIYKTPPISAYAFTMSILSGYPVGAKVVCDLYESGFINKEEAFKICTFTSNSGPMFILGSVGIGMLCSRTLGFIMLFSHIIGALLNGLLYRNHKEKFNTYSYKFSLINYTNKTSSKILSSQINSTFSIGESMWNSVTSILIIGGFICIFFVIIEMLNNLYIITPIANFLHSLTGIDTQIFVGILNGIFEMTHGCLDIANLQFSPILLCCICCGLITFGGLATMMQAFAFLQKFGMRFKFFMCQKITHTLISIIICFILCLIFV